MRHELIMNGRGIPVAVLQIESRLLEAQGVHQHQLQLDQPFLQFLHQGLPANNQLRIQLSIQPQQCGQSYHCDVFKTFNRAGLSAVFSERMTPGNSSEKWHWCIQERVQS